MPPPLTTEVGLKRRTRLPQVLWPAFLMAAVLEMLTFALIDPAELRWLGDVPLALSRQAVYTLSFLVFWLFMSLASLVTVLLLAEPDDAARLRRPREP